MLLLTCKFILPYLENYHEIENMTCVITKLKMDNPRNNIAWSCIVLHYNTILRGLVVLHYIILFFVKHLDGRSYSTDAWERNSSVYLFFFEDVVTILSLGDGLSRRNNNRKILWPGK